MGTSFAPPGSDDPAGFGSSVCFVRIRGIHPSTVRFFGSLAVAGAAGVVAGTALDPRYVLLAVPIALSACYLAWSLAVVLPMDADRWQSLVDDEDSNPLVSDLLVVLAGLGGLGAVGGVLLNNDPATQLVDGLLCLAATYLSWAMVHVMFAARYGRLFYRAEPSGGIDFNSSELPDAHDFLYFSFNLGMTYQVSDTAVSSKPIRRTVLLHCLVSYLFGTMIIACAINLVIGFVSNAG